MMSAKALIRMPGQGKQVTLAGKPMTFLVTGEDTKHTSMFDWTAPPGFSIGLHVHRVREETFYVLEGECEWQIGSQLVRAVPGSFVFIPPGASQHRQRQRQAGKGALDRIAARFRTLFRGACETRYARRPPGCQCHRGIEKPLRHRAPIGAKSRASEYQVHCSLTAITTR
jgi:quercetin dioxygenase-like cupin family protein